MANYETKVELVSESSINAANNTSYVVLKFSFRRTDSPYTGHNQTGSAYWYIDCDGQAGGRVSFNFSWSIAQNAWHEVGQKGFTITHNADGSKKINFSAGIFFGSGVNPGTLTASGSATLATIPRASQPSCITYPDNTQNVGNLGDTINIHMNKKADFTHTVRYTWGNTSGTIATDVVDNCKWTMPLSLANQIPNSTSGSGTIYVDTYNGSTKIGTKSCTFTAKVPSTVVPSIASVTVSEAVSSVKTQFSAYVQNKSKLRVVTSASGAYGSAISSIKATVCGATYTGADITTNALSQSGTVNVAVTVTDSRGRTAKKTVSITVLAYANPSIKTFAACRCDADGVEDDDGECLKLTIHFEIADLGNKNTKSYTVQAMKDGDTAWTDILSGAVYSYNSTYVKTGTVLNADYSYKVRLVVADFFNSSVAAQVDVGTAFTLVDYHSSGRGIAFGKVSEGQEFDVGMNAVFRQGMTIKGKTLLDWIYPVGSIYMSVKSTNPGTLFGGTWEAWGSGRVPVGVNTSDTDFKTVEKTGGVKSNSLAHSHTVNSHSHTQTMRFTSGYAKDSGLKYTGGGAETVPTDVKYTGSSSPATNSKLGTVSNLPPYITCYMWKRTA